MLRPNARDDRAFTLVELMVVVLVLTILIAVAVPQFLGARTRAQDGSAKANLRTALGIAGGAAAAGGATYPEATQLTAEDGSIAFIGKASVSTGPRIVSVAGGANLVVAAKSQSGTCWRATVTSGGAPAWLGANGPCSAVTLTTLAGTGFAGTADGTGTAASFNNPFTLARDPSGNVYVADVANHLIRRVTPAGVVTTLAGSGGAGYANGTGAAASFYYPFGVAADSTGNVFVADTYNHRIRKITPAGVVTTLPAAAPTRTPTAPVRGRASWHRTS